MRPRTEYNNGDKMGTCIFLEEREPIILNENDPNKLRFVKRIALFRCHCGKEFESTIVSVKSGGTQSCGCSKGKKLKGRPSKNKKHGLRSHPLYPIWKGIYYRCKNPNNKWYCNYGGRGIKMCERWESIENFIEDMHPTYEKGLEIDRIDNNGNYEPDNCRWVTRKINSNNKRTNRIIEYKGVSKTVSQWVEYTGIPEQTFSYRLKNWNLDDVFNVPYPTHGGPYKNRKVK